VGCCFPGGAPRAPESSLCFRWMGFSSPRLTGGLVRGPGSGAAARRAGAGVGGVRCRLPGCGRAALVASPLRDPWKPLSSFALSRDLCLWTASVEPPFLTSAGVFSGRLSVNKTLTKLMQAARLFFFGSFVAVFGISEVIKVTVTSAVSGVSL